MLPLLRRWVVPAIFAVIFIVIPFVVITLSTQEETFLTEPVVQAP